MDNVNLSAIDLNLLVVLSVLLEERHVTSAGRRLGLSQSATSNALGRLRVLFDDPLFVRAAKGMSPTPRALALQEPVRVALDVLRGALAPPAAFEPATATGLIHVGISDYSGHLLVPRLVDIVAKAAPALTLRFVAHGNHFDEAAMHQGDPLISIGFFFDTPATLTAQTILTERFQCALRKGDLSGKLTMKRYLKMPHILVAQTGARTGYVDRVLERNEQTRTIRTIVPHFWAVPPLLAESGGIATIPSRIALEAARWFPIDIHPPPFSLPSWPLRMIWHRRFDKDARCQWLRQQILSVADAHD